MKIEELKKVAINGSLDRREFIKRATALGLSIPFATSLLSQPVQAATPKKGGRFIIGLGHGSTTDTLDPSTYENGFTNNLVNSYANNLFYVQNDGQLGPELADTFEASDGARKWVVKLKKGVEFHNGKEVTADDVVTSLNYHRGEDSKSAAKGLLEGLADMKKTGKYEITFLLNSGNADFPYILSDYHLIILPELDGKIDWRSGYGTGAYQLEVFEPGVRATMKRNPNYFKSDMAHFDEIEFISLIDVTARQNAIMNGEVHAVDRVDPKTVHLLSRVESLKILEVTGTLHYTFPMRVDTAPFDSYDFRMAIKLSVDREQMVNKILLGHGALGNDHPISTANPFYNRELAQRKFDPDKARFHLKKAGMEGIKVDLSASDSAFAGAVDAALLLKDSVARAGIDINVVREPKDGYWSNIWNKKPWCAAYWGGRPTEDWMFSAAYVAGSKWNDTAWTRGPATERFNELVVAARAETDQNKRRQMYYECQAVLNDDGGAIVPMFANHIMALNKNVMHEDNVAANWSMDGSRASERWWFA